MPSSSATALPGPGRRRGALSTSPFVAFGWFVVAAVGFVYLAWRGRVFEEPVLR
jgi:hypothetical protein